MVKCTTLKLQRNCFRLLNSEIGNDLDGTEQGDLFKTSFRLLNSEIGNDLFARKKDLKILAFVFVSLTRR